MQDILNLKCSSKNCYESVVLKDVHIKAFEALFAGFGWDCTHHNNSNTVNDLEWKSNQIISTKNCWKQCISHMYKIQARFAISNTVVSTATTMLEYMLKNGILSIIFSACRTYQLDAFETVACVLCFIASKYEDVTPLSLNSIKYYSAMRLVPECVLSFELRLLKYVDPSVSMRGLNGGMFTDALCAFYTVDNLPYKAFFKVYVYIQRTVSPLTAWLVVYYTRVL
jgi:hypothetical protein